MTSYKSLRIVIDTPIETQPFFFIDSVGPYTFTHTNSSPSETSFIIDSIGSFTKKPLHFWIHQTPKYQSEFLQVPPIDLIPPPQESMPKTQTIKNVSFSNFETIHRYSWISPVEGFFNPCEELEESDEDEEEYIQNDEEIDYEIYKMEQYSDF